MPSCLAVTSMSTHSRMIHVIAYRDLYTYPACALSVFACGSNMEKFSIRPPTTKRVAVDSHDRADSVFASELTMSLPQS